MIESSKQGDVHVLTMKNGQNTFDLDFVSRLGDEIAAIPERVGDGPGALVLTGEGKFFSNGLNLEFLMGATDEQRLAFNEALMRMMSRLIALPVPTIAALNGHAFAAGAFLALACDYRIQREDRGWICISEVDVGVPIGDEMMGLLKAKVPLQTVRHAVLSGKRYTGPEALEAGFADAVAPEAEVVPRAIEWVTPLATKERRIFTTLKNQLFGSTAAPFTPQG